MNILEHKSCKGKIQGYTKPLKISLEPERSSTLPNSQLELIYYIRESSCNTLVLRMHLAPANHEHKHCHAFITIA
jgi:hypothetical protein